MANAEHLEILRQGVEIWNEWRQENFEVKLDISGANLSRANLSRANLSGANLNGTNLSRANLSGANLSGANLSGANLSGANLKQTRISEETVIEEKWKLVWEIVNQGAVNQDLSWANLSWANLSGVNLSGANLSGANLSWADLISVGLIKANLIEANLSGANLNQANLSGANLNEAKLNRIDFREANLSGANLNGASLSWANLSGANLSGANLNGVNLSEANLSAANLSEANLSAANLNGVNLSEANLSGANLKQAQIRELTVIEEKWKLVWEIVNQGAINRDLSRADLSRANLSGANLSGANLNEANLSEANLSGANLSRIQALGTDFTTATFTGACIEDWNTNSATNLKDVICDYVYLQTDHQERRPISGNFAPGEFTKLFQKSLETVDLIFRNGIDWDAFAYSFKKVEVENQGAQLDVQSIEKKGDGVILVRVAVAPDADKAKIHSEFTQGYEFAAKALEAQYQARLEDKDKIINQLFSTINQQNKLLAQTGDKVSIYYQPNSQFASGILDANTANIDQMGGNIYNNNA
ncbi:MAG: pentapeptide repeat-containing protein [Nostoc sp. DedQUE12a]|nr:pentapeptide repeat-containing protein [Nostoc sp. DedQUE12a]